MPKSVLTPQAEDYPRWYQEVVAKAEMAENGPVRGTMVVRPYGYAIWERMQAELDARIKAAGARNAYFPLFIPESYLKREAEHVEGFSPELAVVTHGGGKELEEPIVVRPTSETVINAYFSKWLQSYRELPLLLNQWCNVVRWELRPRLFLRTTEFLWQEGHTCHATSEDARACCLHILHDVYESFMVEQLAVPVLTGRKTDAEKFAGADASYTCEGMMGDGKALQMGTSHLLGQNFARVFDTMFLNEEGEREYAWQTSWGVSTRLVGALIMAHGDDSGLRVPPNIAPVQVVVLAVRDEGGAGEAAASVARQLADRGVRVELDSRTDTSFGRRVIDWELKGVPLRVEVGPRDVAAGEATLARRDDGTKQSVPLAALVERAQSLLADIQSGLLDEARRRLDSRLVDVSSVEEAIEASQSGFARMEWDDADEAALNAAGVSVRCLVRADGTVPDPEERSELRAVVGRAY
ncbi:MAG TPA: proline--tRNA ligase [Acidimicrobiales bacterium]|nr:proline--tRNA ligase [Acidimicrobiales bacterium]